MLTPTVCVSSLLAPTVDSSGAMGTRLAQAGSGGWRDWGEASNFNWTPDRTMNVSDSSGRIGVMAQVEASHSGNSITKDPGVTSQSPC